MSDNQTRWYVKARKKIQGPYTEKRLRRYEAQGRLRPKMRLSKDKETWLTPEEAGFRSTPRSGLEVPRASVRVRKQVRELVREHAAALDAEATWSVAPDFPEQRLAGALEFAELTDDEEILAINDMTLRGSGQLGCVFTNRGLHFMTHGEIPIFIPYPEVANARLESGPMTIALKLNAHETLDFPTLASTEAFLKALVGAATD